ncbi:MAG: sigma-70 family RNA polymerase sigma factor [Myxococcota bacterium]
MAELQHGPDRVQAWVEAAQGGDREAFGLLYEHMAPVVHGLLLSRVRSFDVSDLVQEVFASALQRLPTLQDPMAFAGWLCAIARNAATDHLRRTGAVQPSSVRAPYALAPHVADARRVLEAIRTLPEAYREPLVLRLVEGLTGREIAERTGLTPGSVRVNLSRGMKRLRETLGVMTDA